MSGPDGADLRAGRSGEVGDTVAGTLDGLGLGCFPLAWVHACLDGCCDEVGQGVGLVGGHLVEGAPRHRAVAAEPTPEGEKRSRGGADPVGCPLGHVGPQGDVGGGVASVDVEPEPVSDRNGLDGHEQAGSVLVIETDAVAAESLHPAERPAPLDPRCVLARGVPGLGQQLLYRLTVARERVRESFATGGRLGSACWRSEVKQTMPTAEPGRA